MDKRALHLEDGTFAFPLYVKSIVDVPETHRDWYNPQADGDYKLKDPYWTELRLPFEREIERLEKAQADLAAKHEADMAQEKQARKQERINATLLSTCEAAGIPSGLIEGAIAMLSKQATFDVDDSYAFGSAPVIANSGGTLNSIETLVENFLDSDSGAAFRGKRRAAPSDGYFSSLLADLKARR
ncbi:hypothetical protein FJV83_24170 [Mesorhizobium sp. WSM4307]|uniref:hypothetical protein n=1 Tax=unclassified Mesorhizobium TaxID=325217 RepID=UPI00115DCEAC|nr:MULTISPECIES: hypothetical protein [unclassified Mesorhizobium]TRC76892.1 hypothetical protein FJV81_14790 [Mesorhizobium sp. WSM4315]TRC81275.1 hypothetical protein FJV83_24170 [Mesorhizobium sp. WSM4307]